LYSVPFLRCHHVDYKAWPSESPTSVVHCFPWLFACRMHGIQQEANFMHLLFISRRLHYLAVVVVPLKCVWEGSFSPFSAHIFHFFFNETILCSFPTLFDKTSALYYAHCKLYNKAS
jgi:hypothetical protein